MQFEELLIPNIIEVTKSVKMRQEGYVTWMRPYQMHTRVWPKSLKRKDYLWHKGQIGRTVVTQMAC
jgi:hypothetical protein